MNKLKAYSIIEMMVVMLISMIIIGIAYNGYLFFYKQFLHFQDSSDKVANDYLFNRLMQSDISDCHFILKKSKGMDCHFGGKKIVYEWNESYILRKDNLSLDTFYFHSIKNIAFTILEKPSMENQLVDEVIFEDHRDERHYTFRYRKQYGADVFINTKLDEYVRN